MNMTLAVMFGIAYAVSKKKEILITFIFVFIGILCSFIVEAVELPIPYPAIDAPVVHSGRYHVLPAEEPLSY